MLAIGFVVVLGLRWAELSAGARSLGVILFIALLFTVRGQLARGVFRCLIEPEHLRIVAPLVGRSIPWDSIAEVRRMKLSQFGAPERWACTLLVRRSRASLTPVFAFDDQLEAAEEALQEVIRRTPHARHINV